MTRKHFKLIAKVIFESFDVPYSKNELAFIEKMAEALRTTNSYFDREKFKKACGVTEISELEGKI